MFQNKKTKLVYYTIPAIIIATFLVAAIISAWTEPTASPPSSNVSAPLNVSSVNQTKTGNLTVGTAAQGIYAPSFIDFNNNSWKIDPSGNSYFSGNVGIGTTAPGAKLEVAGQVKITGGSPGAGKVLTSDASGLASWSAPSSVPSSNTPPGGIIMYSGAWNFDASGLGTGSLAGWALCNGNNNTPNLSDKFVMGTVNSSSLKTTGGANSYQLTTAQLPSHNHTFTTNSAGCHSHTITINSAGAHTHTVADISCRFGNYGACLSSGTEKCRAGSCSRTTQSSGEHTHTASCTSAGSHTHSGTTNSTGNGAAIDNRPAFIQLAFIMKL